VFWFFRENRDTLQLSIPAFHLSRFTGTFQASTTLISNNWVVLVNGPITVIVETVAYFHFIGIHIIIAVVAVFTTAVGWGVTVPVFVPQNSS
jgi:hypothetical protein